MSYKSRQRKRQIRIAVAQSKREHGDVMATRYYRTLVKRSARCSACGKHLRPGDEMVYRHNGKVTLCIPHADGDPLVEYRTSAKWEQWRKRSKAASGAPAKLLASTMKGRDAGITTRRQAA